MMRLTRSGSMKLVMTAIMLLWASMVVTPAKADSVTFGFEGIVNTIESTSETFYREGNAFDGNRTIHLSGFYAFDPAGTSLGTDPVSQYSNIISHFEYTLHRDAVLDVPLVDYSYTSGTPHPFGSTIIVGNDVTKFPDLTLFSVVNGPMDGYRVVIPLGGDPSSPSFDFNYLHTNGDSDPGPFSNSSLGATNSLLTPSGLNWLQEAHAFGGFRIGLTSGEIVNGTMLSMYLGGNPLPTVDPNYVGGAVPEPSSLLLFGAGLVSLIGLGARNWRQRKDGLVAGAKNQLTGC